MAKLVSEPVPEQVTCSSCKAVMSYLPEEVERHSGTDYTGGSDGYERVKCPRPGCTGHGYVRQW